MNVWLYAALLPLWDGFDEPFHYGYVHQLSHSSGLPVSGRTMMPAELCESLRLVPAGVVAQRNLKFALTHEEYLRLPPAERQARRAALRSLPAAPEPGGCFVNYEAQQAPLAYAVLALPDVLLRGAPLPDRILILRGLCGSIALLLLMAGFAMLSAELRLSGAVRDAALFATLCVQMFYATTTHITNDFLAAPLFTLILATSLRFFRTAAARDGVACAATVGAALATKAYFLAAVPVFAVMLAVLWRARRAAWPKVVALLGVAALPSAWWYLRNVALYGTVSGINQANGGATLPQALRSLLEIRWPASLAYMLRGMLWTGNNSFTAFSQTTLNILLILGGTGVALFLWRRRGNYLIAGYFGMFVAALIYSAGVFYFEMPGQSRGSSPWYILPLVPALYLMATRGLSAWAAPFLLLNAYVINATYLVKLIPQYGGYAGARSTPGALWDWYMREPGIAANLRDLCLGPPVLIAVLTGLVLALSAVLSVAIVRDLSGAPPANQE